MSSVLTLNNVGIQFGGLKAVDNFNLDIKKGELFVLIGPNGAGKTTCFNMITGVYKPTEGEIKLNGEVINGLNPHKLVEKGISRTFQNIRLFGYMSVLDNVRVAQNDEIKYSIFDGMFGTKKFWKEEYEGITRALELLKIFDLDKFKNFSANALSYGDQRKLEIARAMATNPSILLLDDPSMGLSPLFVDKIFDVIKTFKELGVTVLLVEQNANLALGISYRAYVLETGKIVKSRSAKELANDPSIKAAYLEA